MWGPSSQHLRNNSEIQTVLSVNIYQTWAYTDFSSVTIHRFIIGLYRFINSGSNDLQYILCHIFAFVLYIHAVTTVVLVH